MIVVREARKLCNDQGKCFLSRHQRDREVSSKIGRGDVSKSTVVPEEHETFQIVSFSGNEFFANNVYPKDKLRTYFSCAMFYAKAARNQSLRSCDHMFGHGIRFYCVESIHVNVEFSCNCMKIIEYLVVLLNKS